MPRFLTITALHPQAGELANRDDTGSAKTLVYGGVVRTRISSQAQKRRWRKSTGAYALTEAGVPDGWRSRRVFSNIIFPGIKSSGVPDVAALALSGVVKAAVIQTGRGKTAKAVEKVEDLDTEQAVFVGKPETDYLTRMAVDAWKNAGDKAKAVTALAETFEKGDGKANIDALRTAAGLTSALFGRFITSDILARTDAAIHVGHAFTVHAAEAVDDYFTAVDDLETGTGAGHLDNTELTSGLMLKSVVVDIGLLIENLSNDADVAAEVVRRLVHLIATESVSAKKGSTAPHARAQFVLLEAGDTQPRTLAAAFEKPVRKGNDGWLEPAMHQLAAYVKAEDEAYGIEPGSLRIYASVSNVKLPGAERATVDAVAEAAAKAVLASRAGSRLAEPSR